MYSHNSSRSQHSHHHNHQQPQQHYEVEKMRLRKEDSALTKLCELHVYKVPTQLWREPLNNIVNNLVTETVSIGIIRVPYDLYLREIRHEIDEQLQQDEQIPQDYVFLKSVGRCLTRLRTRQEQVLKAKHFLPPVSVAPELYILESTPEIRDALAISERSSQSPPLSRRTNRGYPHSYRSNGYRGDSDTDTSRKQSSSPVNKYQALPQIEPSYNQRYNDPNQMHSKHEQHFRPNEFQNGPNGNFHRQNDPYSQPKDPSYNREIGNYNKPNGFGEYMQNNDPYNDQREPHNDPYNDPYRQQQPHSTTKASQPYLEAPESEQQDQPEMRTVAQVYQSTEPPRGRSRERSPSQRRPPRSPGKEGRHDDDSGVAGFSPEDELSRRNRENYENMLGMEEERRRRLEELENRNNLDKNRWDSDEEERKRRAENDRRRQEEDMRREREEEEERRRREENERMRREEEERRRREEEEERRRREEDEERRRKEEEREREEEENRRRRDQNEEEERRQREEQERRQREEQERREEEERQRNKRIADSSSPDLQDRDTESARQRRRDEKVKLLQELEEARRIRHNQEIEREELVRRAKSMQHKTTNRRNEARDMWKKKYFEEKKKTAPMEETRNRSEQELDNLHRRLMNTLEGPKEKSLKITHATPSDKNNYVIQCTKLQHEIEDLQRRVENAKMKLTAEMKLRNQAQGELRALRAELAQQKTTIDASRQQQLADMAYNPKTNQKPPQIPQRTANNLYGF